MARKKKTVEAVEMVKEDVKPVESPVEKKLPQYTEYQVSVVAPAGLPDAREHILKTKYVPGSWMYSAEIFEGDHSFLNEAEDKVKLCVALLNEIDKGNAGAFNDAYFLNADKETPGLGQFDNFKTIFRKGWQDSKEPSLEVYAAQYGLHMRAYWRQILFRFMSYFAMGYKVTFAKV